MNRRESFSAVVGSVGTLTLGSVLPTEASPIESKPQYIVKELKDKIFSSYKEYTDWKHEVTLGYYRKFSHLEETIESGIENIELCRMKITGWIVEELKKGVEEERKHTHEAFEGKMMYPNEISEFDPEKKHTILSWDHGKDVKIIKTGKF